MTVCGIDIGGSGTRLALRSGDAERIATIDLPAAAFADDPSGSLDRLAAEARALADGERVASVAIGAAGLTTHREDPGVLETRAERAFGADHVLLTADIVAAHVGALDGRPGAVLAAGTGAIAVGTDLSGRWLRTDGWGHLIGDLGSGAWIGIETMRAAAAHLDGRSPGGESLSRIATERFGPILSWPGRVYARPDRARVLAALVPEVVRVAPADPVAARILDDAAAHLATTVLAALGDGIAERVAITGGLSEIPELLSGIVARVREARPSAEIVETTGRPLDGALWIAERLGTDPDPVPGHRAVV